jgi:hypothetical protein
VDASLTRNSLTSLELPTTGPELLNEASALWFWLSQIKSAVQVFVIMVREAVEKLVPSR